MKFYLLLISTIFYVSSSSKAQEPAPTWSSNVILEGNTYTNGFWGIQLKIDTFWQILNRAEINKLIEERTDLLDESTEKSHIMRTGIEILLSLTPDTNENMPFFMISAINLSMFPEFKNEIDYLNESYNQSKQTYEPFNVHITRNELSEESIGNKTFVTSLITITATDFLAYQLTYCTKINDHIINITMNYNSEINKNECLTLLNSIVWK